MFKSYLKVAIRNFIKSKGFSFINITGLAIGMACCVLILLFVEDETRYDSFHENSDRIYRVTTSFGKGGSSLHVALTQAPLAGGLKENFPEIEAASVFAEGGSLITYGDNTFLESFSFVGEDFFKMFSFEFVEGEPGEALSDPNSVVITESAAEKYFGDQPALGKTLTVKDQGDVTVRGVLRDVTHSHIDFNFVLTDVFLDKMLKVHGMGIDNWGTLNYSTYLMMSPSADHAALAEKISGFIQTIEDDNSSVLHLQPLEDIYLHSDYAYDIRTTTSDGKLVYILLIVAAFILVIACINFMNLATARSEKRIRETSLRKVFGAKRSQLIVQFMGEAVFLALGALLLTILFVVFALPYCNDLFQKELVFSPFMKPEIIGGLFLLALVTGLFAGIYPAMVFSSQEPSNSLKRSLSSAQGNGRLRKTLVVLQFACSIMLIISTMVVYQQLRHFQDSALGYEKEHLVFLKNKDVSQSYEAFKNKLLSNSKVVSVTGSLNLPTWSWPGSSISEWDGNETQKEIMMNSLTVNHDYFETYGMEIVKGRAFSKDFPSDVEGALIVNQEAIRQMEVTEPIGKKMAMSNYEGKIIGVVKDFHFDNLRNEVNPLVIKLRPTETSWITIRIARGDLEETISFIKETGKSFAVNYPVNVRFLDEALENLYRVEQTIGKAALYFSILAILVASLGLFGLASFSAERRTREIGVRKVLGASVSNIILLLSREFSKLVAVAFIIAAPIAYLSLELWLQNFASRTEIGWEIFLFSAMIASLITYGTVGYQAVKAALTNPAKALRHE